MRATAKRRFVPSKWEHKKVMKIVRAIRQGRIVPSKPSAPPNRFYSIWSDSLDASRTPLGGPMHMPAPKLKLPGHDESYNPPEEYLFDDEEKKEWEGAEKEDRKTDFLPAKYGSLRRVPGYGNFLQERFDRLLDLYLAPRMLRRRPKLDISDPSELLPKLPSPRELRPFPTSCALEYPHDSGVRVRCVSVDPTGTWVATGADNGEVRLWECRVGRCAVKWQVAGGDDGPVYGVEWCPDKDRCILAIAVYVFASSTSNALLADLPRTVAIAERAGYFSSLRSRFFRPRCTTRLSTRPTQASPPPPTARLRPPSLK